MEYWQQGWVWVVAGVVLGVLEMLIPGFVFLGFAIGAVIVGALIWVGVLGHFVPLTLLAFAVLSVVTWLVLRRVMGVRHGQTKRWDRDINEN
jgi:membrane protein implicated in regulation of membrane protease activity